MPVLALGCGVDDGVERLAAAGFRVAGMDVRADEIASCKERLAALGHRRVELRASPIWCFPWPDQSFDIVVSDRLLGGLSTAHFLAAAKELARVLRQGGIVVAGIAPGRGAAGSTALVDEDEIRRRWSPLEVASLDRGEPFRMLARRQNFTEDFAAAFREISHARLPGDSIAAGGDLRERIVEILPTLGYGAGCGGKPFTLIPRHKYEHRLLPLVILDRHAGSDPCILYDIRGGVITLKVFGPLDAERRSPYARFDIDCNQGLPAIEDAILQAGVRAVHRDIAVGVHATERLLRSGDLRNHASTDLPEEAAARLESLLAQAVRRCDLLGPLFRALHPVTVYAGHDCYDDAVDVNVALGMHVPVLVQPKGKLFQHYGPNDAAGRWTTDGTLFRSHLNRRFGTEVETRWESMDPTFVADAHSLMERRMGSLSALPYMRNVSYRDWNSDVSVGWRNFRDELGVPVHEPGRPADRERVAWILSLHSFADEPFRWGMDRLWSLYDMFLVAARHVRDAFPTDLVVLRPHPNSLGIFSDPQFIPQVESGSRRGPTDLLDIYLQLRLCQAIAGLGIDCELSSLQPAEELLRPERSIVVTRHGSIMVEASWIERAGIFSRVAPYAFLFPADRQFYDAESLRTAMRVNRERVLSGTATFPPRPDLARYQAILDTPGGVKRASVMGEVNVPNSAIEPMRNFDDFRYGPETVEQAAARLGSCLAVPTERAALMAAFGRTGAAG